MKKITRHPLFLLIGVVSKMAIAILLMFNTESLSKFFFVMVGVIMALEVLSDGVVDLMNAYLDKQLEKKEQQNDQDV